MNSPQRVFCFRRDDQEVGDCQTFHLRVILGVVLIEHLSGVLNELILMNSRNLGERRSSLPQREGIER